MVTKVMCQPQSPTLGLCESVFQTVCGQNIGEPQMDTRIIPQYLIYMSHSISIKQFYHFFQLFSSGKFCQYDYQENNMKIYNSSTPPDYNLSNIKAPIYIYSGGCDALCSEIDIVNLRELLPNVKKHKSIRNYNHCDFNYAKNSRSVLFKGIVRSINSEK